LNKRHYKLIFIILFISAASSLFALTNKQYIVPVDEGDNIMEIMQSLYIQSGKALPSATMPYSVAELELMTEQIKYNKLSDTGLKQYNYLKEKLKSYTQEIENDIYYGFNLTVDAEAYAHLNTDYFTEKSDWGYDFQDQQKFLTIDVDFMAEDLAYSYVDLQLGAAEYLYNQDSTGISFGTYSYATNIPFLDIVSGMNISTELSDRAFVAIGGNNWSAQFGRDQLSWGNGVSGNLFLSDNLEYQNMGRYTFFGKNFKYTYLASFFPFQANYVETEGFELNTSQTDTLQGFSMFTAHKIEGRTLFGRLGWGLSEGLMFVSEDGTFDVAALNPMLSYHSLFYKANSNSIIAADLDFTIGNNLNLYAQVVIDDLVVPIGESKTGSWSPDAYGAIVGLRYTKDELEYQNSSSFEFAYTTPYLYLRNDGTSDTQDGYGINFIVALRKFDQNGIYYDEQFLGYEYGGDAIVFNFNNKMYDRNKWSFETNLFLMCHGTFDTDTTWSTVGPDTDREEVSTPTTYNYQEGSTKNAPEYTGILGFNFTTRPVDNFSLYAQLDFIGILNPDNVYIEGEDNLEGDIQLTVGSSITF
jgi:hypothetical protein